MFASITIIARTSRGTTHRAVLDGTGRLLQGDEEVLKHLKACFGPKAAPAPRPAPRTAPVARTPEPATVTATPPEKSDAMADRASSLPGVKPIDEP